MPWRPLDLEAGGVVRTVASHSHSPSGSSPKINSHGYGEPSQDQRYLLGRLVGIDDTWQRVRRGGVVKLNRDFGYPATTEALRSLLEEVREHGLLADNPYALLFTIAKDRAARGDA